MRPLRLLLATVAASFVLGAIPVAAQQGTRGVIPNRNTQERVAGKRRVLVVGVNEYADTGIPQLRYATTDAMAFVGWLRSPVSAARVDSMVILMNRDATRAKVLDAYRKLAELTQPNDELILYFAGHGGVRDVRGVAEGYLFPHDAVAENIASNGIPLYELKKEASYLPETSQIMIILDACRSGNIFRSNQMSRAAESIFLNSNVRTIVSSSGDQDSQEGDRWEGHGAFTYFLLNGLYGMADTDSSGSVSFAELGMWVAAQVERETNDAQSPQANPMDRKWGVTVVQPSLRDSVARRVAARGRTGTGPVRGSTTPPAPASTAPAPAPTTPAPSARPAARPAARRGGAINVGDRVSGELSTASPMLSDSTRYDTWTFTAKRGDRVAITMRSGAFDPYLVLTRSVGSTNEKVAENDDGGGGTDSRIAVELPADGQYTIVANALVKEGLGQYTLSLETVTRLQVSFGDVVANAAQHPVVRVGSSTNGTLTAQSGLLQDGSSFDAYTFEGRAGESVEILMQSTDFDAFLGLGILGGDSLVAKDDDNGGNSDALIVARLPRTGRYVILANSYGRDAVGAYTLVVRAGKPIVPNTTILGRAAGNDRLRLGQSVSGDLRRATEAMVDASPFQVWYFEGRAGQRISVNMRSTDFDNYLHIGRVGAKTMLGNDDDSGGGTNARLSVTLPDNGLYAIIANSLRSNDVGSYTLNVLDGSRVDWTSMSNRDILAVADSFPRIQLGQTARGQLSATSPMRVDETPFAGYVLAGRRGDTFQIDMEAGFDSYLTVGRAGTDSILGNDDDGGEGTNARLTVTLPADGRYVIFANSVGKDARGDFILRVTAGRATVGLTQILARTASATQTIRAGQTANGRLSSADPLMQDRTAFATWFYQGRAGERITVTMRSTDFDAFLHIGQQGQSQTLDTDDDGAGGTDSRMTITLPRDGIYVIVANMVSAAGSGAYTLEVASGAPSGGPTAAPARPATPGNRMSIAAAFAMPTNTARVLRLGQTVNGTLGASNPTLGDNSPFEAWYIEGRAGERITITMRSSDFDAYLQFGRQGDQATLGTDDDSGGNSDAQLTITLPATGTYVILANTFAAGASGSYRLEVSAARGADDTTR